MEQVSIDSFLVLDYCYYSKRDNDAILELEYLDDSPY